MSRDEEQPANRQVMMHGPLTFAETQRAQKTMGGEYVIRIVEAFPPVSAEVAAKLAVLLAPETPPAAIPVPRQHDPRAELAIRLRSAEMEAKRLRKELAALD